jgi:hypothetical protein
MLKPVQQNRFTNLRVLVVLIDRSIIVFIILKKLRGLRDAQRSKVVEEAVS